jgi:hypothetical protein
MVVSQIAHANEIMFCFSGTGRQCHVTANIKQMHDLIHLAAL